MANRYWVGGTGTWDATTTHWSTSSGGASGASAPGTSDVAIFDSLSNSTSYTVTRTATTAVLGITMAGPLTGTLTFAGSSAIGITTSGLSVTSTGVSWTNTGVITFSGTCSVTTNGVSLASPITINVAGITVTLGSALTTTGAFTLTSAALSLNGFSLTCNTFVSNSSNTRSISFGSSSINITGSGAIVLSMATATGFTYTGTPTINCTYSGSTGTRTINFGSVAGGTETNALNINITAGSDSISNGNGSSFKDFNLTGFTGNLTNNIKTIYGNLTFGSGMTTAGLNVTTFAATSGTQVVTLNGVTALCAFVQDGVGGTVQLGSALLATNTFTLTNGIFNANNYNVTVSVFSSNNSNTRTITMGSGAWTLTASGTVTVWDLGTTTGLTFNKNTANISINAITSSATKTFAGGGLTYNNLTFSNVASNQVFAITGANTFNTLSSTKTNAWTLTLPASTTTTVSTFSLSGTLGNVVTLNSSSAGTQATLSQATGTVNANYLSIQDSNATGGAIWNAYSSTNVSNNTGWNFGLSSGNYFLLF